MSDVILEGEGLAQRRAALDVLIAALDHRGGLDEALARPAFHRLEPRERAFARALAMATLRRLGQIDAALDGKLHKPPPDAVRAILRLGAAQLFFMEAPDFAVVNTSVALASERKDTLPFKGLINAVLRGLARARRRRRPAPTSGLPRSSAIRRCRPSGSTAGCRPARPRP